MNAFQGFPRITPFLWFDGNAEEAVQFYLNIFKNSRRLDELRTTEEGPGPKGSILTVEFELDGQKFTALNGGPLFKFNEAVSFVVRLRLPEGSRLLLVQAHRRRRQREPMRLAQRQVRSLLADRSRASA